jgi:Ca-activated chloride channel family protein
MSFASPGLLALLVLVPLAAAGHVWLERRRDDRAAAWARPALLPNMVERPPSWRRHLPTALLLLGLALLLVGFARPKLRETVGRQDATMILVLDVSGSMAAKDSLPTRIAAARAAADRFVAGLPHGYRMSVIVFSDHAAVVAPPTQDLARVRAVIAAARTGPQGTALSEAVWHAVDVARTVPRESDGRKPPAEIVVFSDGGQTAGRITLQQAIAKARDARVPVSAVAIGTPSGIVDQPLQGGLQEQIQVPVEPQLLQQLARSTGGRFFAGARAVDVAAVYRSLGSRVGRRRTTVEVTAAAAGGGLACMLAGAALSGLWFRRLA